MLEDMQTRGDIRFLRRMLIALALLALAALLWATADLLLLIFAGLLVAIVLESAAALLSRLTGLSQRWSLTLITTVLALILVGGLWAFGAALGDQLTQLQQALPNSFDKLEGRLKAYPQVEKELDQLRHVDLSKMAGGMLPPAFKALSTVFGVLVDLILVLFFGLYIAAEPAIYRWGLLALIPKARRPRAVEVLDEINQELKRWMLGQLVAMLVVTVLAGIGLGISQVAAWPALALLTGALEFIPIVGPLTAAVPALLVAFAGGAEQTLWVAGTFLIIHEFESSVLVPLIQRRAASLPPLVSVGTLTGAALVLGLPGLVLATPLAVAIMVMVRMLYVEDTLGGAPPKPA